ncbi:hypothetical protein K438DRAFT_1971136 [Mycena galopus ATCC 62051]|nr:hypothetical protein K438DRAFT_1971136 [Mycena galopus ATCC 62051]
MLTVDVCFLPALDTVDSCIALLAHGPLAAAVPVLAWPVPATFALTACTPVTLAVCTPLAAGVPSPTALPRIRLRAATRAAHLRGGPPMCGRGRRAAGATPGTCSPTSTPSVTTACDATA